MHTLPPVLLVKYLMSLQALRVTDFFRILKLISLLFLGWYPPPKQNIYEVPEMGANGVKQTCRLKMAV